MAAQETCDGLGQLMLGLGHLQVVLFTEEGHAAQHVPLGQNGGGGGEDIPVGVVADRQGGLAGLMLVELRPSMIWARAGEMLLSVSSRRPPPATDRQTSRSVMVTILPVVL